MRKKARITHRCVAAYEYGTIACEGKRHSDGTIAGRTCGDACSWIMGKAGHGSPPWHNVNDERRDPFEPDDKLLERICLWHNITNPALRVEVLEREKAILLNALNGEKSK